MVFTMDGVSDDQYLPLIEHIKELRSRMIIILIILFSAIVLIFPISGTLIDIIWANLMPQDVHMIVYSPLEWMVSRLTLTLAIALIVTVPVCIYESFLFMKMGLYPVERKFFLLVVPVSFIMSMIGASVAYFLVIPLIFNYMVFYSTYVASSGLSIKQTFSVVSSMLVMFGMIFQFPILVVLSIKSGLLEQHQLKNKRMFVYGLLIAFAMFVAPDITGMSQLIMAVFLVVLFEFSLLISRFV